MFEPRCKQFAERRRSADKSPLRSRILSAGDCPVQSSRFAASLVDSEVRVRADCDALGASGNFAIENENLFASRRNSERKSAR